MPTTTSDGGGRRRLAALVALGILSSRIVGLIRQRVIAHYLGLTTDAADVWAAGFRIPNLLQNLFGEGALSASFIPVYAALHEEPRKADRLAGTVAALLALAVSVLVFAGIMFTPAIIGVIAPGFAGSKRDLTITVVRILFPGAGLLVLSAWCLGVLNSHHRFFLSYAAPIMWSAAMIAALLWYGARSTLPELVVILGWASVAGSALQCVVQLPVVLRVAPHLAVAVRDVGDEVRTVIRNFVPALVSRGVVQISAYVDTLLASLLPTGAVAALTNAQLIAQLPVSLFGISVSAAELPSMAREATREGSTFAPLVARLDRGLRQIAFFVVPAAVVFLAFGDLVAGALLETGRFSAEDADYVWGILAGSGVGLLASTQGRLYASAYYALRDTRTPLRYAMLRVALATMLGYTFAIPLPAALGIDRAWGAAGLTAAGGLVAWLEMSLLRRTLTARIGARGLPPAYAARVMAAAAVSAAVAWQIRTLLPVTWHPLAVAAAVLGPFAIGYFALSLTFGVEEATALARRARRSASGR